MLQRKRVAGDALSRPTNALTACAYLIQEDDRGVDEKLVTNGHTLALAT